MAEGKLKYHILAFLVAAVWGITFICTKVLIGEGLHPSQIFTIRFTIAYAGIWLLCLNKAENKKIFSNSLRDELILMFLGISGGSVYFLTENTALACTQACNVSFIVCSAPLLTTFLTILIKKLFKGELVDSLEDVSGRWTLPVGTVFAIGGMAAVLFDGNSVQFSVKGDLLAFCAAACWALYSVFMGQMTERYGTVFATRKVFFYGLVTIIPFIIGKNLDISIFTNVKVWGNLLFLSVFASLLCFVIWNKVLPHLGNITATNYVYLNPLFTLVSAVLLLGESLTFQSGVGCAAILAGVIIGGLQPKSRSV